MLSVLIKHAIDLGWRRMGDNPASEMSKLETGDGYLARKTPHADPRQTQYYRAQADQKVLANRAMAKLNAKES